MYGLKPVPFKADLLKPKAGLLNPILSGFISLGFEWLRFHGSVTLFDQHLNFALSGIELFFAGGGEADAFLEELERIFEAQVTLFELIDDGLEFLKRFFEGWHAYSLTATP